MVGQRPTVAAACLMLIVLAGPTVAEQYAVIPLGTLGGRVAEAYDVNENDVVVGQSSTGNGETHAFAWTHATGMIDLGTLGGKTSCACGVNNRNEVVGWAETASGQRHPFIWNIHGGMHDLETETGGYGEAWDISDSSVVTGTRTWRDGQYAFRWHPQTGWQNAGAAACGGSRGKSVNSFGDVAGINVNRTQDAWFWSRGTRAEVLPVPEGVSWTEAWGINDAGVIVGTAHWDVKDGVSMQSPMVWVPGEDAIELGPLNDLGAWAWDINDNNTIVGGRHSDGDQGIPGFVCQLGGPIQKLSDLVPGEEVISVGGARGINNRGRIAARATTTVDGETTSGACLLIPLSQMPRGDQ